MQTEFNRIVSRGAYRWYRRCRVPAAWMVDVGFTPPEVTQMFPSTMKRFFTSWQRPTRSRPSDGDSTIPTLCIAAYAFLIAERARVPPSAAGAAADKFVTSGRSPKSSTPRRRPAVPNDMSQTRLRRCADI